MHAYLKLKSAVDSHISLSSSSSLARFQLSRVIFMKFFGTSNHIIKPSDGCIFYSYIFLDHPKSIFIFHVFNKYHRNNNSNVIIL